MYFKSNNTIKYGYNRKDGYENRLEINPVITHRSPNDSTETNEKLRVAKGYVNGFFQTSGGEFKIKIINPRIAVLLSQLNKIESSIEKEANSIIVFDQDNYYSLKEYIEDLEMINSKEYNKLKLTNLFRRVFFVPFVLSVIATIFYLISFIDLTPLNLTRFNWVNIMIKYLVLIMISISLYKITKGMFSSLNRYELDNLEKDFRNSKSHKSWFNEHDSKQSES